jgi:CRISPR-associated Csx2 family protein
MNKKVLILTLGTGSVFGKEGKDYASKSFEEKEQRIREMIESDEYPYEKTEYIIENAKTNGYKSLSSEYVAEIQIEEFQPDMVIIIGTVKSCWSMFYRKFTQNSPNKSIDDVMTLFSIEQDSQYGINTDEEKLKELESKIQDIYNGKLAFRTDRKIDIKVCLIRYGINNAELMENYRYISGIERYLEKGVEYEVAFDITHSFRSLPVYNLVILNYLQQVSQYDIKISHIFYGNFDVKRENGNKAPLVDLADIGEVLNLTNAVSEFKNTGNAKSLINILPDSEKELRDALENFDIATQLNGRYDVFRALKELSKVLKSGSEKRDRYVDAKKMIKDVLSESKLLDIDIVVECDGNGKEQLKCDDWGNAQLILAKWYQRQNRYGIAVATASEALRSMLVPFYLEKWGKDGIGCEDENVRKCSIQRLGNIKNNKDNWIKSPITDLLVKIEEFRAAKIKKIRDTFAHNLLGKKDEDRNDAGLVSKQTVDEFISLLSNLQWYICDDRREFKRIYCYDVPKTQEASQVTGDKIRIFVSGNYDQIEAEVYNKLEKSNNSDYCVYKLPNELIQIPNKSSKQAFINEGHVLGEYIKRHFEDAENIQIIFDGEMTNKKWINYSMILYNMGFRYIFILYKGNVTAVSKGLFDIDYDENPIKYDEKIMNDPPILHH